MTTTPKPKTATTSSTTATTVPKKNNIDSYQSIDRYRNQAKAIKSGSDYDTNGGSIRRVT
ncbi:hypothetical protein [Moraxella catarrhalis]|uniref:hypothetical protein n=1 Tax=Moraxella catarrhalis TaxID=480 RepID=UPI001D0DAA03|nr:hypothetical protein [Moraxella catarrhalis]